MPQATGIDLFVGREREMAEIVAALDGAVEGRGGLVMLAGEPGIGKTRLTEELTEVARDRGALVTSGACYEGGSAPPYWPWTQTIRSLLTEPTQATLNALNPRAAVIAEIVPEIRNMMPDMQSAPEVEPAQARFRLFDAVTSFLNEAAASQPLVLVLDDLHWADRSSLDLLEFVAREVATRPMLLIGGYRDMELSRRHPLSETLATLARVRGFQRILLRGLEGSEVGRLVEAVGHIALPTELIEEIHDRTEGNPFFVGEVTRDLAREAVDRGGDFDALKFRIPEGVREAIGIRLNRLSEECNEVLRTAAVIGREFDFALLSVVSAELSEDALLRAVGESLGATIVRDLPGRGERYEFAHALIQQTLSEELSTSERTRLHARIVDAMEELYADRLDEHVAELAHHCSEAETVVGEEKVALYARMAGERAASAYAFEEAGRHFETAYAAARDGSEDAGFAAVLSGLGRSWCFVPTSVHSIQDGWDLISRAFDLYLKHGDRPRAIALALTPAQFAGVHGTASLLGRALELVTPDTIEEGRLFTRYSIALIDDLGDTDAARAALDRAEAIADRLRDPVLKARALTHAVQHAWTIMDFRAGIDIGHRAAEAARAADDAYSLMRMSPWTGRMLLALGEREAADRLIDQSLAAARRARIPNEIGLATLIKAEALSIEGDFEGAAVLAAEAERLYYPVTRPIALTLMIKAETGTAGDDRAEITSRLREGVQHQNPDSAAPLAGATAAIIGNISDDREFMKLARSLTVAPDSIESSLPRDTLPRQVVLGFIAAWEGDRRTASRIYPRLRDRAGTVDPFTLLSMDRVLGMLARALERPEDAARHFEDALEFCRRAGYRPQLAWTCHDYAETLLDQGPPVNYERTSSLISDGHAIAKELGMRPLEKRLTALRKRAEALSAPTPAYPDGLTGREVEVLRLLAAGSTNQQIADELVIASSTAAKHVANILGKTGSSNRAEAATYANQQGLVKTR